MLIAILSTAMATVFGTFAAVGIHGLKPKMRKVVMSLTNIPMTNPDIVTGVSLSLLFVFVGSRMLGQRDALTFWTLLIAHTHCSGFSCCRAQAVGREGAVVVVHGLSYFTACGIFLDQG